MSPRCRKIQERLTAYRHGELPADEAARVATHLEACSACREVLAEIDRVDAHLGTLATLNAPTALRARLARVGSPPGIRRKHATIAAATLLTLACAALFAIVRQPRVDLMLIEEPAPHELHARRLHAQRLRGRLPLSIEAEDVARLQAWTEERLGLRPGFEKDRPPTAYGRIEFRGATWVEGHAAVLFQLEIGDRPASLVMRRTTADSATEGTWAKRVYARSDPATGHRTLTWTTKESTYVLVSELPGFGQAGCLSCHTAPDRRRLILGLSPRS